jgi:PHD/YefM family antitoxin component YafN of YafNO toxin-antitoxin module
LWIFAVNRPQKSTIFGLFWSLQGRILAFATPKIPDFEQALMSVCPLNLPPVHCYTTVEVFMRAVDIIMNKRAGKELSRQELAFLIGGYADGEIPDYQISAWAMAVFFRGMTAAETAALTQVMLGSGAVMDLTGAQPPLVDKHSTGGVGDKTSLILAPLAASMPAIRKSAGLRDNYGEISAFCHKYREPVFITNNGQEDLAVMSIETYEYLMGKTELHQAIQVGLDQIQNGEIITEDEMMKNLNQYLGK